MLGAMQVSPDCRLECFNSDGINELGNLVDREDYQGMNHHFGDSPTLSPVTKAATKLLNVLTIIERTSASCC